MQTFCAGKIAVPQNTYLLSWIAAFVAGWVGFMTLAILRHFCAFGNSCRIWVQHCLWPLQLVSFLDAFIQGARCLLPFAIICSRAVARHNTARYDGRANKDLTRDSNIGRQAFVRTFWCRSLSRAVGIVQLMTEHTKIALKTVSVLLPSAIELAEWRKKLFEGLLRSKHFNNLHMSWGSVNWKRIRFREVSHRVSQ